MKHNHPALSMAERLCTPSDIARVRESIEAETYELSHLWTGEGEPVRHNEVDRLDVSLWLFAMAVLLAMCGWAIS